MFTICRSFGGRKRVPIRFFFLSIIYSELFSLLKIVRNKLQAMDFETTILDRSYGLGYLGSGSDEMRMIYGTELVKEYNGLKHRDLLGKMRTDELLSLLVSRHSAIHANLLAHLVSCVFTAIFQVLIANFLPATSHLDIYACSELKR